MGADTVVVRDDQILEKPKSVEAAHSMLRSLSGRSHEVVTGCVIVYAPRTPGDEPEVIGFVEATEVEFAELSDELIAAYVECGEPMDKAGAYGIQGRGGSFVRG